MSRLIIFLIVSPLMIDAQTPSLIELRNLSSGNTFAASDSMDAIINSFQEKNSVIIGYGAIAEMIRAKSSISPFEKIRYFKVGRNKLEASIRADYYSVELRYLRFCIQTNIPFFLNYSSNIEEDKRHILNHWSYLTDTDLKQRIKIYMMRSDFCTEIERRHFANG
jgi:hypothetical protein